MSEITITDQKIHTLVANQTITSLNEARESVAFAELATATWNYDLARECIENALHNLEAAERLGLSVA